MSLKIQNASHEYSINNKSYCKNQKLYLNSLQNQSPFCEQTQRINVNHHKISANAFDLDMQETERNHSTNKNKPFVWLSQIKSSSDCDREASWNINLQSSHQEKIDEIHSLLEDYQLIDIFETFEEIRNVITDQLESKMTKIRRYEIIELIQSFKAKFNLFKGEDAIIQSQQPQNNIQIQELLKQIIILRSENANLKQKIKKILSQHQNQNQNAQFSNSILNNSLSFHTCGQSITNSDQSFQIRIEKQFVKPFIITKQLNQQESTINPQSHSSHQARYLQSSINCINSFLINNSHQEIQTDLGQPRNEIQQQSKFIEVINGYASSIKQLLQYFIQAVNYALINDKIKLKQFNFLFYKSKQYKINSTEASRENYLKSNKEFISFVDQISLQMSSIVRSAFSKMKLVNFNDI